MRPGANRASSSGSSLRPVKTSVRVGAPCYGRLWQPMVGGLGEDDRDGESSFGPHRLRLVFNHDVRQHCGRLRPSRAASITARIAFTTSSGSLPAIA